MFGATWLTAAVNVFIGVSCLPIGLRSNIPVAEAGAGASGNEQANGQRSEPSTSSADARESRLANAALIAFGLSGFASFALEAVWTRVLLNPSGVVCKWMPIYQMSPTRLRSAMKTFCEVFPNATFWYVKNHGLFIAKVDSPVMDYASVARRFAEPSTKDDLARIDINTPEHILSLMLMGPDDIQAYLNAESDIPINTDDYPYLEYFVPGDLFHRPVENVREIVKHLADPRDFLINQPPESVARVRALIEWRAECLVSELQRPKN